MSWKTRIWPSQPGPRQCRWWDGQLGRDLFSHFAWHAFEHDCAGAGMGQRQSVCLELLCRNCGASLDAVAAHAVEALRGEAEVADNGNLGVNEGAGQFDARPFDLDCFGPASLTKRMALFRPSAMEA